MTSKVVQNLLSGISLSSLWKLTELRDRILFTFLMIVIYRIGSYTPLPCIDTVALFANDGMSLGHYGALMNTFSGGALSRCSVMSIGFSPYITGSIIMQLFSISSPEWMALKKEGEAGQAIIKQYTKYWALFFCVTHSAVALYHMSISTFVIPGYSMSFLPVGMICLISGTMTAIWMSEQIDKMGIGQGLSILLCANILSELPRGVQNILDLSRLNTITPLLLVAFLAFFVTCLWFIVYMEASQRRIPLMCPNKTAMMMSGQAQQMYIPIKINTANITPVIFAGMISAIVHIGIGAIWMAASYVSSTDLWAKYLGVEFALSRYIPEVSLGVYTQAFLIHVAMSALIIAFSVMYVPVVFPPNEVADNLNNNGNFVPGFHPGPQTVQFFEDLLFKISLIGGVYLSIVYAVPGIVAAQLFPQLIFSGTSMLIVVNVITETLSQIGAYSASIRYQNLGKSMKQATKSMMRRFKRR
jgi:preprotein translocase subunit SecY